MDNKLCLSTTGSLSVYPQMDTEVGSVFWQLSLWRTVFISFAHLPRKEVAGASGGSVFDPMNFCTVFPSDCTDPQGHQECTRALFFHAFANAAVAFLITERQGAINTIFLKPYRMYVGLKMLLLESACSYLYRSFQVLTVSSWANGLTSLCLSSFLCNLWMIVLVLRTVTVIK
jgi:hypothetical protein